MRQSSSSTSPASRSSDQAIRKEQPPWTHILGGCVFFCAVDYPFTILWIVALTAPEVSFAIMLVAVLGVTAIAGVYSYVIWKKLAPAE